MDMSPSIDLSRHQLEWLKLALSAESHRPVLNYAKIEAVKGRTYIVSTDTHRLHMLKVAETPIALNCNLDVRRLVHELKFHRGARGVKIALEDPVRVEIVNSLSQIIETIERKVLDIPVGIFPNWQRVVPEWESLQETVSGAAFNFQYLADAAKLSSDRANRVHLLGGSPQRPFVLTAQLGDPWRADWAAIIMPMAAESVASAESDRKKQARAAKKAA